MLCGSRQYPTPTPFVELTAFPCATPARHLPPGGRRLLASHPSTGRALTPHFRHLVPAIALFRERRLKLWLPPPACVAPTASFAGFRDGSAAAWTHCPAPNCGRAIANPASVAQLPPPGVAGRPLAPPPRVDGEPVGPQGHPVAATAPILVHERVIGSGLPPRRYILSELVEATLAAMVRHGGRSALAEIKRTIPTFDHYDPQD